MAIHPFCKIHTIVLFFIAISIFLFSFSTLFASEEDYLTQKIQPLKNTNKKAYNDYAFKQCRSLQAKPFDQDSKKKKLIIVGDSQGCDFLNGVIENGYLKNYQVQFRFIPYACQRVPNENIQNYISPKHQEFCLQTKRIDSFEKVKEEVNKADLVIFSSLWKPIVANKLPKIFHYLGIRKQQQVVVIGYKFFGKINPYQYTNLSNHERRLVRNDVGNKSLEINSILKKSLIHNAIFINPHQLICGNTTNCPLFTYDFKLISYDGRHLTKAGARYMARILFQNTILGSI